MAYFPRVGTELSGAAKVHFLRTPIEHDRPAHVVRFENGWSSGRFATPAATFDFTAIFEGPMADVAVMTEFFSDHGVVVSFTLVHPYFGTGNAKLKQTKHPIEPVVAGGADSWFRIEIPIEGQF